ncbi:MAG: neutral/alkaline non-lysosomal ceramidase N-terminal domain-containing protein [Propionibacteriaceae bacterium]|jgi:hypothetical protein|nr:neutral/alkaline non-lysosomal ceramidase N-terminal domain-containing protein [Propionibacteriaceae bacterium]
MTSHWRVGAGSADIDLPVDLPMAGYARRQGASQGVERPLQARAWACQDPDGRAVCWVVVDILCLNSDMVDQIRQGISDQSGSDRLTVVVSATHTHSGPRAGRPDQDPGRIVVAAAQAAGLAALDDLGPARLWAGAVAAPGLGMNRRDGSAPDLEAHCLVASELADPTRLKAVLVEFPCHATVFEHDNLLLSPDYPGHFRDALGRLLEAPVVFLQGCAGDINPIFTGHDSPAARQAGLVLAATVGQGLARGLRDAQGPRYVNLTWNGVFPAPDQSPWVELPPGLITSRVARVEVAAAQRVPLERAARELERARADWREVSADLAAGAQLSERQRLVAAELGRAWAAELRSRPPLRSEMLDPHQGEVELRAHLIGLGPDCALCSLPGEAFVATADWLRRLPEAPEHLLVGAYAEQAFGYLPPLEEYDRLGYEVGAAHLGPGSVERLVAAVADLFGPGPDGPADSIESVSPVDSAGSVGPVVPVGSASPKSGEGER